MHEGSDRRKRGKSEKGKSTNGGKLCHGDLSLCQAGDAQGFPQSGQRNKPGPV